MNDKGEQESIDTKDLERMESEEAAVLNAIADRQVQIQQRQHAEERDRNRLLTRAMIETIPNAADTLRRLHEALAIETEWVHAALDTSVVAHQQHLFNSHHSPASGGLIVKGAPYDFEWRARRDHGSPDADKTNGAMELSVNSGFTPNNVETTWNGAGIGLSFRPRARSTYVRVAPFLKYSYKWSNDSTLEVARNRGELGVRVRERGNGLIIVDKRVPLWNDGTSWYQKHSDQQDDIYTDSTYFFASSDQWYSVWFWFNSSIDFNHMTGNFLDFGMSRAINGLFAHLVFVVFEQWT